MLFYRVLFKVRLRYLSTIGLTPIFSLRRDLPPHLGYILKQPDSYMRVDHLETINDLRGYHPLWRSVPGFLTHDDFRYITLIYNSES